MKVTCILHFHVELLCDYCLYSRLDSRHIVFEDGRDTERSFLVEDGRGQLGSVRV